MTLQEATKNWSEELTAAGTNITKSSLRLQSAFADASNEALHAGDDAIPDPVKMIHRVVALELAMKRIHKDCHELAVKRKLVALEVLKKQQQCVHTLCQLEERLTIRRNKQDFRETVHLGHDQEQREEWKLLSDQLSNQLVVFENDEGQGQAP